MAEKRMFAKTIVESDMFYNLSVKAQNLYFHLGMVADDDGFMNNALTTCKSLGFAKSVLQELIDKRYLLDCGDGITCVKHWKVNNTINKDRYKPTMYQEQLSKLSVKENKSYTEHNDFGNKSETKSQQKSYGTETQIRIDKNREDKSKNSIEKIDDDIQLYNARLLEAGVSQSTIDGAVYYYQSLDCPQTKDFYLTILDVMQNKEIINKYAYLKEIIRNDKNREIRA